MSSQITSALASLEGKTVLLVGGAGLLGRSFSDALAAAGANLVIADINRDAAEAVAGRLREGGQVAVAIAMDISDAASIDAGLGEASARFGRVDALVNTAYPRNPRYGRAVEEVTYADFCDNVGLHLGGYFLTTQRAAIHMKRQGGGAIVNLGSIYGSMAPRFEVYEGTTMTMPVEYAAIKSGIIQITKYFAQYYKKDGLRANVISPGGILDRQHEDFLRRYKGASGAKGMLDPADVAASLVFLVSDNARHITGQNLIVDDGFSL